MSEPQIYSLPFTRDTHGCSQAGAEKALPKAGSQALKVLTAIADHGPVTDRDIVELTGYPINVVCARRHALVKQGRIKAVGTRMGACNVQNTIWAVK